MASVEIQFTSVIFHASIFLTWVFKKIINEKGMLIKKSVTIGSTEMVNCKLQAEKKRTGVNDSHRQSHIIYSLWD